MKPYTLSSYMRASFFFILISIAYLAFRDNYDGLPKIISISDIINHFVAFFVLSFFLDKGFGCIFSVSFVLLLSYGFFIEIVQYFLPHRMFDLLDVLVDISGIVVYYFFVSVQHYYQER